MSIPLNNRYANIDIIRGLAALLVVWMHVSEVFKSFQQDSNPYPWSFVLADTVDFGRIGVVAFFAVSGFVIPASFNHSGWLGLKLFVVRRFFRLYPAFWLSIPLAIWSAWYLWDKPVTWIQVLANLTIIPQLWGQEPLEGLYWTLQVEVLFYILCAFLFWRGWLIDNRIIALISFTFFWVFLISKMQGFFSLGLNVNPKIGTLSLYLSIMFWGALFRKTYDGQKLYIFEKFVLWFVPASLVILLPLMFGYKLTMSGILNEVWIKFIASHALGIVLFLVLAFWINLASKPLVKLGEISYSLYLFHPVVFYPVYWWAGNTNLSWVRQMPLEVWILFNVLLSIIVATLVYRYVESPAINMGKAITQKIRLQHEYRSSST